MGAEIYYALFHHDSQQSDPFPSNRHHRSNDDCLEGKRKNYEVCSVQYCVQQSYTELHTHMNRPNSSLDWVCLTGLISLCLGSLLCMYYFVSDSIFACTCSIVI